MTAVLALLLVNAALGAVDTLWYHEYRCRLAARVESTAPELRLHVARDAIYVGIYGALAWLKPGGVLGVVVAVGLVAEVLVTMTDFVVEDRDRPAIGGVSAGERVLHAAMAVVYGAMLAFLVPELVTGLAGGPEPFGHDLFRVARHPAPSWLSVAASVAAGGIALSGLRDWLALHEIDPVSAQVARPRRQRRRNRRCPAVVCPVRTGSDQATWATGDRVTMISAFGASGTGEHTKFR